MRHTAILRRNKLLIKLINIPVPELVLLHRIDLQKSQQLVAAVVEVVWQQPNFHRCSVAAVVDGVDVQQRHVASVVVAVAGENVVADVVVAVGTFDACERKCHAYSTPSSTGLSEQLLVVAVAAVVVANASSFALVCNNYMPV